MKVHLTDISVRNLKTPPKGQATYWDTSSIKGFGVRCSQAGSKSYVLKSKNQLTTLGRIGIISLAQARAKAKHILAQKTLGVADKPTITFQEAKDLFFAHCEGRVRPRTISEYRRLLNKHLAAFDMRPLAALPAYELASTLDNLKPTPVEQNHTFAAARTLFRFCIRRGLIPRSPLEGMALPARVKSRERILDNVELKAVVAAAGYIGYPFGQIVLLLILTGQRKGEIAALESAWIDKEKRTITIPGAIAKNHRQHTFPYNDLTAQVLEGLPSFEGRLFHGVNWDRRMDELREKADISHFTLHDLRRTYASGMAALGVPPHVVEKLLNHVTGTVSGIAAVYNRYRYWDEQKEAVAFWEAKLSRLAVGS